MKDDVDERGSEDFVDRGEATDCGRIEEMKIEFE